MINLSRPVQREELHQQLSHVSLTHRGVAKVEAVADQNVFVLRLRSPDLGPALARYLNGREGFALRRMVVSGSVIPSLRRSDLERLPVREEALEVHRSDEAPVVPLAERLEQTLWPH